MPRGPVTAGTAPSLLARNSHMIYAGLHRNARQLSDDMGIPANQRIGVYFTVGPSWQRVAVGSRRHEHKIVS